jgi:hypothetical protein
MGMSRIYCSSKLFTYGCRQNNTYTTGTLYMQRIPVLKLHLQTTGSSSDPSPQLSIPSQMFTGEIQI